MKFKSKRDNYKTVCRAPHGACELKYFSLFMQVVKYEAAPRTGRVS